MQAQPLIGDADPPHSRFWRTVATILALFFTAVAARQLRLDWQRILDLHPLALTVRANLPEKGGWQSGPLQVESGRTVRLTVASVAGTHSFALAHTQVKSSRPLGPGEAETVEFVAPAPGRYLLYCTTWCSPDHWRMRAVIEVVDPEEPDAPLAYPQTPPRYRIAREELPLDVAHQADTHTATAGPNERPNAATGAALWAQFAPARTPKMLLGDLGWPVVTPQEVYAALGQGTVAGLEAAAGLSDAARWSLVAYLWQQSATPQSLARGAALFQENCADCHGATGRGDGLAAPFSPAAEPDFAGLTHTPTRSPAVYYAKIARGGMGTGMPNWGTILDENDLWALTDYLTSLMFDYTPKE
ncbi:MAG: c-type cytochrome [Caldilineaceae bacterium]|nr:c-type cytochrome [Caldilineaceae bacterium]